MANDKTGYSGPSTKSIFWPLTLSRPGGHFVPPSPISQHISKTAWSLELLLGAFSFYVYSFQKSSVPPISPHVCCHGNHATFRLIMYVAVATMQLFGLFLRTQISIVFQVFPPERNFMWDNFLCFGHQNSLISSGKANTRAVTMETIQKILLPKYGHRH